MNRGGRVGVGWGGKGMGMGMEKRWDAFTDFCLKKRVPYREFLVCVVCVNTRFTKYRRCLSYTHVVAAVAVAVVVLGALASE